MRALNVLNSACVDVARSPLDAQITPWRRVPVPHASDRIVSVRLGGSRCRDPATGRLSTRRVTAPGCHGRAGRAERRVGAAGLVELTLVAFARISHSRTLHVKKPINSIPRVTAEYSPFLPAPCCAYFAQIMLLFAGSTGNMPTCGINVSKNHDNLSIRFCRTAAHV
jgi:hypothetical protein